MVERPNPLAQPERIRHMKMHPKPMARHTKHVEPVAITPHMAGYDSHPEPFHIQFRHAEGRTQLLTMTRDECLRLFTDLGAMLRFEGMKGTDLDPGELRNFKTAITAVANRDTALNIATDAGTQVRVSALATRAPLRVYLTSVVNCTSEAEAIRTASRRLQKSPLVVTRKDRARKDCFSINLLSFFRQYPGQVPFELEEHEEATLVKRLDNRGR